MNSDVVKTLRIGLSRLLKGKTMVTTPANTVLLIGNPVICIKLTLPKTNQQLLFVIIKNTTRVATERSIFYLAFDKCSKGWELHTALTTPTCNTRIEMVTMVLTV